MSDDLIKIGSVIESRYEITALLGEGGFGVVYKARQISTGQDVAIKLLHPAKLAMGKNPDAEVARFEREMRTIGSLKHPNIVRLIDSGRLEKGHLFTVLEYVEGEELNDLLEGNGPLSLREAKRLMTQVLEALASAHAAGIVHRDLKPQNIMVTSTGSRRNAMVLDFGIATLTDDARGASFQTLTQTGQVHGTPIYMAPEQLEGKVSTQSDIYAWGLVFCEIVSGRRAIEADSVAGAIYKQLSADPIEVPNQVDHPGLRAVLSRAVAKRPDARYPSAEDILANLEHCVLIDSSTSMHTAQVDASPHTGDNDIVGADTLAMEVAESTPRGGTPRSTQPMSIAADAETPGEGTERDAASDGGPVAEPDSDETEETTETRSRGPLLAAIAVVVLAVAGGAGWWWWQQRDVPEEAPPPVCQDGQLVTEDTHGKCCYPGQAWNGEVCVGLPNECPTGRIVDPAAQTCSWPPCRGGRVRASDDRHCCWPQQAWSAAEDACIGTPTCPDKTLPHGEVCLALSDDAYLLSTSCEAGNVGPCVKLALVLQNGSGAERNSEKAVDLLEAACAKDNDDGCYHLAVTLRAGIGVEPDRERARELLDRACETGHRDACFDLAETILDAGDPTGRARGETLLVQACDDGNWRACDTLAMRLQHGDGLRIDEPRAAVLYEKACTGGWRFACTHLAWMLRGGLGVQEDAARAAQLFDTACTSGETLACAYLGDMLEEGEGVDRDGERATELREMACRGAWYGACDRSE